MYILIDYPVFVETIGFIAVLIEAMLAVAQFYKNLYSKSTYGMRYVSFLFKSQSTKHQQQKKEEEVLKCHY